MQEQNLISRWSNFFVHRYKSTLLIIAAIIIAGLFGVSFNQRQDFPTIPSNFISVRATYIGASAEDIEQDVIIPVEQSITNVEGIKTMRSSASDNFGSIVLEMNDVDGTTDKLEEVEKELASANIPADVEIDTSIFDAVGATAVYALVSEDENVDKATVLAQATEIKDRLLASSSEIKEINLSPGNEFELQVILNAEQLNDENITGQVVTDAISGALTTLPGGSLTTEDDKTLSISVEAPTTTIEELQQLTITDDVVLEDVAEILRVPTEGDRIRYTGYIDSSGNAVSKEAVYLEVVKKDDGDVIRISEALAEEQAAIIEDGVLSEGVGLELVFDNADGVRDQINDLLENGAFGLILILLVLMLFINLRTGIVVATIIPLAFMGTLAILYAIGFSINILTLFGLILVLGILVDNAIVIAEGITHEIEEGKSKIEAIQSTMFNLGPAVTAATLTTVIVFIPFASIGGIIGAFLKFIPFTIIIMLIVSYLLAITVSPMVSRFLLKEETREQRQSKKIKAWHYILVLPAIIAWAQRAIDALENLYTWGAGVIFSKWWSKVLVVGATLGLLVFSVSSYASQLGFEEFPSNDGEALSVEFAYPIEATKETKEEAITSVMNNLIETEYFESYYMQDEGFVFAIFASPEDRAEGVDIFTIRDEALGLTNETVNRLADAGIDVEVKEQSVGPPSGGADVTVELRGSTVENLTNAGADIETFLADNNDVEEITNSITESTVGNITVTMNDEELTDKGINSTQANAVVNSFFSERTVGALVVRNDGVSDDIVVSYSDESKNSITDLRETVVGANTNVFPPKEVTLEEVASVEETETLQSIRRLDQKRVLTLDIAVVEGVESATVETLVKDYLTEEKLEEFNLASDDVVYGGIAASNDDNFANLQLVFILAMIGVYLVLVYQFNSYVQPGLIMFTVPMAMIGVFPALFWVGSTVNMISGLGIVALVGIVVNDAIVFVDYFNRLRKNNPDWGMQQVITATGRARFKPILSTSVTTIFGILPLTLRDPFWQGLGTSLIAGLICSTIGTLIVFPILLSWNDTFFKLLSKVGDKCKTWFNREVKKLSAKNVK